MTANQPGLRASHQDRDHAVEILRAAAGEGRLTTDEMNERIEAARSARTGDELAALMRDLPDPADMTSDGPADLIQIDRQIGDVVRTGRWMLPRRMDIRAMLGDVKLDFTEAEITAGTIRLDVDLGISSDMTLIVRPGMVVDTANLQIRHGDVKIRDGVGAGERVELRIEVTGRARGDVVARFPHRTFGDWVQGKPHPYAEGAS
jgi:hypothetical protein